MADLLAGFMRAPACGSFSTQPVLSAREELTALRIFRVQSSGADFLGIPSAVINMGRNLGGCPAHLATGSSTDCHNTAVLTGYPASSWARQWVLQDAGLDANGKQLVYVLDQVGGWGGCGAALAVVAVVVSVLGLVLVSSRAGANGGAWVPSWYYACANALPNVRPSACPVCTTAVQARPAGCASRYLGASATNCSNAGVSLHSFNSPSSLIKWRIGL